MADRQPSHCSKCGQPLPAERPKDPPLAPLEQPNIVTIHDLPPGTEPEIVIDTKHGLNIRRLRETKRNP
jgi:hypothetical protein